MPPYTESQHRLFETASHDKSVAKRVGIPQEQAKKMASEGIAHKQNPQKLAKALMNK
jgi:hypothetical protein